MTWLIVLTFALMWVPDLPMMLRQNQKRALLLYGILWCAGLTISLIINYGGETDQVTKWLRGIFEPVGKLLVTPPPS